MATFSVEVSDEQVPLIGEAFAQQYNMDGADEADVPTKIEFTRQQVMRYINDVVRGHLVWKQQQTAPEVPDTPVVLS